MLSVLQCMENVIENAYSASMEKQHHNMNSELERKHLNIYRAQVVNHFIFTGKGRKYFSLDPFEVPNEKGTIY